MMAAPASAHNFYKVLGVKKDADEAAIRDAYKAAVIKAHPDKPGGSDEKFKLVQKAYETLKCPIARRQHNTKLAEASKVRAFAGNRPAPLDSVKLPLQFRLLDGTVYDFETAPDRLRCRFRHGDVVQGPCGNCGVVIGLATNGIYWCKNGEGVATLLFSPGMGGDRDIKLVFKSPPMSSSAASSSTPSSPSGSFRRAPGVGTPGPSSAASPRAGAGAQATSARDSNGGLGAGTPRAATRRDVIDRQAQRRVESLLRRVVLEEGQARKFLQRATDDYFAAFHDSLAQWLRSSSYRAATSTSSASAAGNKTPVRTRAVVGAATKQVVPPPITIAAVAKGATTPRKPAADVAVNKPAAASRSESDSSSVGGPSTATATPPLADTPLRDGLRSNPVRLPLRRGQQHGVENEWLHVDPMLNCGPSVVLVPAVPIRASGSA